MAEKRQHQRIKCAEKCVVYYANSRYSGAIMNISLSGAMVTLSDFAPGDVLPGKTCSLLFTNDPATSFLRYKSRIKRVTPEGVGLEILAFEF